MKKKTKKQMVMDLDHVCKAIARCEQIGTMCWSEGYEQEGIKIMQLSGELLKTAEKINSLLNGNNLEVVK